MTQISTEDQLIIAGYVLGDLEPEEMARVEQRLATDAALSAEAHALQVSLWSTPQGMPMMTPPPQLRDKILTANALAQATATPTTAPVEPVLRAASQIPQGSPSMGWGKIIAGLATLLALLLGADNFRLRQALSFAQQPETAPTKPDSVAAILQRPNSRLVALKGEKDAAGTILFTPGKWQEVVVSLGNLPPLPPDQIYRMWLTLANDQTIACGEFNTDAEGSVFVKLTPPKTPPKGVKATGIYVTVDGVNTPLNPEGDRVMSGSI
jgi:anti-sigma-K factor RskA